jgi:predicted nuclease of predicted toxin-antitoxin system
LRLIADENLHQRVISGLRAEGHEVLAVAEERPSLSDPEVVEWARTERCVVITSDRDFGRLLVADGMAVPDGIIYLRLPRRSVETILDRLRELLKGERDLAGHLVVVAPAGERWRPLSS